MAGKTISEENISGLFELLRFSGAPKEYWPLLLERTVTALGAHAGALMVPPSGTQTSWRCIAAHPLNSAMLQDSKTLERIAGDAMERGQVVEEFGRAASFCAQRLGTLDDPQVAVAVLLMDAPASPAERAWLRAVANLPYAFRLHRSVEVAESRAGRLAAALEIGFALQQCDNFDQAGMTLCNETAARFEADRVSLGWGAGGYVQLQAVSHTERVDRKTEAARRLSAAMEECLDQDDEIVVPALDTSLVVVREHENLLKEEESGAVVSIPLRFEERPVGVIMLERRDRAFNAGELEDLRLIADQCADSLEHLRVRSQSWLRRLAGSTRRSAARMLGYEHTWLKVIAILIPLTLLALALIRIEHHLRAPFVLKTEAAAELAAPFPGFIETVHVNVGAHVEEGDLLVSLDRSELLLQEAEAIADRERNLREAQRFETQGNLADMRIARLRAEQAEARLRIVRHRLQQAEIRAPFTGIVIEGDLRERIAAPVSQGDQLMKVVQLKDLYGEIKLDERDMPHLKAGAEGGMAFASRPSERFPFQLVELEPVAAIDDKGTSFLLRAEVQEGQQDWWRPGMGGVSRIEAGKRSVLWIVSHRTVEFLRLFFWV